MITTPSAQTKDATRHLIGRAATPPRRGGEKSQPAQFSYVNITVIKNSRTKLGGNCRAILDTSGHRPRLQAIPMFCNSLTQAGTGTRFQRHQKPSNACWTSL